MCQSDDLVGVKGVPSVRYRDGARMQVLKGKPPICLQT